MVCGAGITGIQASLDLAESGFKVYLVEPSPAIGGRMSQLDKTFPTGDCAMCILSPKLVECARNKNIEIITLADVQGISGDVGNFDVKLRQRPRYIDMSKCNACGDAPLLVRCRCPANLTASSAHARPCSGPMPRPFPMCMAFPRPRAWPRASRLPSRVNAQGYVR